MQQQLSTFEHVVAFPRQARDEAWPAFVARVQEWSRARIEKAHSAGAYRALPYYAGLEASHLGLLVTLAYHSWSDGVCRYAPIRLGERSIAALLGDTSRSAKRRASEAVRALVAAGALEVLEEARGRRSRLLRVSGAVSPVSDLSYKEGAPEEPSLETKGHNSPPAPETTSKGHNEAADAIVERFKGDVTPSTANRWVERFGAELVLRQLAWLSQRDLSGWKRGPVAAFHYFCANDAPAPEGARREEIEAEYQQRLREASEEAQRKTEEQAVVFMTALLGGDA